MSVNPVYPNLAMEVRRRHYLHTSDIQLSQISV